jgi:hypothetical protein
VRQLQELDGLHQLRRHHQGLALTDQKFLKKRHVRCKKFGPFLAYPVLPHLYTKTLGEA